MTSPTRGAGPSPPGSGRSVTSAHPAVYASPSMPGISACTASAHHSWASVALNPSAGTVPAVSVSAVSVAAFARRRTLRRARLNAPRSRPIHESIAAALRRCAEPAARSVTAHHPG